MGSTHKNGLENGAKHQDTGDIFVAPTSFTALAFGIQVGLFPLMAKGSSSSEKVPDLAANPRIETDLLRTYA
jgi:hypothetical protein